ncbi:Kinase superfamily protein isoform 2 [Hibiscus syriacus]|uniref:Kinase superfamily protein isoform 2 n=1 Tax=Hibiscus syriacus TaxID=106335 RepID=A0A6A3BX85_HIBSY|nr:Kinase superfamily protein isoform 2 [Hibiscus syriacus]
MPQQIKAPQQVPSFEYELLEGDPDQLRIVVATPSQAAPWINPLSLKLKHRIGRGPFGDVWLATHHQSAHKTLYLEADRYTSWYLSKDRLQVGDTVRSRTPLNARRPQTVDFPECIMFSEFRSRLERITSGLAAGDWVRLKQETNTHSPMGILHLVRRDGTVTAGFIGLEKLWTGKSRQLEMAKPYYTGQFARLKATVLSPSFEWPRKRGGAWSSGRISEIHPNGCLVVEFPGIFVFGNEPNKLLADPAEGEPVSFDTCPGIIEKYQHLEDFHWDVRPLAIAFSLLTAMKLTISVGRCINAILKENRPNSKDGAGRNPVCGSKRSFFEDIPSPPPASSSKKIRRCSPSSPSSVHPLSALNHLQALFPHMDLELLEKALLECGNDIDCAVKMLQELCLGAPEVRGGKTQCPVEELGTTAEQGISTNDGEAAAAVTVQNPPASENLPVDGAAWVDLFVREMKSATSMEDAKARASRLLAVLENSISKRAAVETVQSFHKVLSLNHLCISTYHAFSGLARSLAERIDMFCNETRLFVKLGIKSSLEVNYQENTMLKEQIEALIQENTVLKRAVAIQHERQKEYQDKNQELQHLKQLVSQYQEQLRTLEVNNYALLMHLKQAHPSNSVPGHFNPDIF